MVVQWRARASGQTDVASVSVLVTIREIYRRLFKWRSSDEASSFQQLG